MSVSSSVASRSAMTSTRHGNSRVPRGLRHVGLALDHLLVAVARQFDLRRVRREQSLEAVRLAAARQVHARVVEEVGLGDGDLRAAGHLDDRRQRREPRADLADLQPLVRPLLVRQEARLLREVHRVVAGEAQRRLFGRDLDLARQRRHAPVRHAVVVGADDERVVAGEVDAPLVEAVANVRPLHAHDGVQHLVHRARVVVARTVAGAPSVRLPSSARRDLRGQQHRAAVDGDRPARARRRGRRSRRWRRSAKRR